MNPATMTISVIQKRIENLLVQISTAAYTSASEIKMNDQPILSSFRLVRNVTCSAPMSQLKTASTRKIKQLTALIIVEKTFSVFVMVDHFQLVI